MFRLESVGLLFRQKDPTTVALFETHHVRVTPHPASFNEMDARRGRASQLAALKQGSPAHESVHSEGRAAGVGPWEANIAGIPMKERGTVHSGATRKGWSGGKRGCDPSLKISVSSRGCKIHPTRAEPGKLVVSLAPARVTVLAMRR